MELQSTIKFSCFGELSVRSLVEEMEPGAFHLVAALNFPSQATPRLDLRGMRHLINVLELISEEARDFDQNFRGRSARPV